MQNRFLLLVFAALSIVPISACETEKEMAMNAPPAEISSPERMLDTRETAAVPCTAVVGNLVAHYDGIVPDSEVVSHDSDFGYIYRYDIERLQIDDGSFHAESGMTGQQHKFRTKLVAYSHDCKTLNIATYPMLDLHLSSQKE